MAKTQSYAGLKRLLAKVGISQTSTDPVPADDTDEVETPPEDEDGVETPPAAEGEGAGGEAEGEEGSEGGDEGEGGAADPEPEPIAANIDTSSPAYRAGFQAAQARWATVLLSDAARANLELATDLLAEDGIAPERIVQMCENHSKGSSGAEGRLQATTPKPKLGHGAANDGKDPAKEGAKAAVETVNARIPKGAGIKELRAQQGAGKGGAK